MPADAFAHTLDDLVLFAIRLQEQAGLDVVSDGEWRARSTSANSSTAWGRTLPAVFAPGETKLTGSGRSPHDCPGERISGGCTLSPLTRIE
jgi:hypothetical protein